MPHYRQRSGIPTTLCVGDDAFLLDGATESPPIPFIEASLAAGEIVWERSDVPFGKTARPMKLPPAALAASETPSAPETSETPGPDAIDPDSASRGALVSAARRLGLDISGSKAVIAARLSAHPAGPATLSAILE